MTGGFGSKINLMHMKEEKYGILFKRAMVNYSSSLVAGRKKALVRAQQEGRMGGYKDILVRRAEDSAMRSAGVERNRGSW